MYVNKHFPSERVTERNGIDNRFNLYFIYLYLIALDFPMSDNPMSENPTPEDIAVFKICLIKQLYKTAVLGIGMLRSRG